MLPVLGILGFSGLKGVISKVPIKPEIRTLWAL